ncbi:CPBP family intramembrane glutamic endopeptidase [Hymenobacter sp. HD11105]
MPLLYSLIAYLLIWGMGWGGFFDSKFVTQVATSFGWGALPSGLTIMLSFIFLGIFGMAGSMATALGEEIGWRGFLVPELAKTTSFTKTSLIVGIVWAIWHYPILIFADYNSGTPVWYGLACFTTMVVSISFIFTWFRLKSNSLWTGALLHASHNLFIQSFFSPLTADTGRTNYYSGEFGIVVPVICIFFALYFWRRRGEVISQQPDTAIPVHADTLTPSLST